MQAVGLYRRSGTTLAASTSTDTELSYRRTFVLVIAAPGRGEVSYDHANPTTGRHVRSNRSMARAGAAASGGQRPLQWRRGVRPPHVLHVRRRLARRPD